MNEAQMDCEAQGHEWGTGVHCERCGGIVVLVCDNCGAVTGLDRPGICECFEPLFDDRQLDVNP